MQIVKLLHDYLLVRLDPRKKTTSGGIIRTTEQPVWTGVVLMAGPGRQYIDKYVPVEVKVGERVAFLSAATDSHLTGLAIKEALVHNYVGEEIAKTDEQRIIRENDVLFVIEGEGELELTKDGTYFG
jgi:co-chaperonin GroES (HSP10)